MGWAGFGELVGFGMEGVGLEGVVSALLGMGEKGETLTRSVYLVGYTVSKSYCFMLLWTCLLFPSSTVAYLRSFMFSKLPISRQATATS